jgi:hypothetical protein
MGFGLAGHDEVKLVLQQQLAQGLMAVPGMLNTTAIAI